MLDGNMTWNYGGDRTGYKYVQLSFAEITSLYGAVNGSATGVKYNGKILRDGDVSVLTDTVNVNVSLQWLYVSISDTDSGWGEDYFPKPEEIQAYFNGWVMYDISVGNPANKYNNMGTKGWCYRLNTFNVSPTASTMAGGTNILPTSPAPNTGAFTPYKLTYQLATPTFEEIQVEGSMSLHEGLNQIELGQGVIVREKVVPDIVSGTSVELNQISLSPLMRRTNRILSVYRNGKLDPAWQISNNNTIAYWNGGGAATISSVSNYDRSATYEVSYITLDLHSF